MGLATEHAEAVRRTPMLPHTPDFSIDALMACRTGTADTDRDPQDSEPLPHQCPYSRGSCRHCWNAGSCGFKNIPQQLLHNKSIDLKQKDRKPDRNLQGLPAGQRLAIVRPAGKARKPI
jgi:hypothetical protein